MEKVSIDDMKEKIVGVLTGLEVVVEMIEEGEHFENAGYIQSIDPWGHLQISIPFGFLSIPFLSVNKGIYRIKNARTNEIVFENPSVLTHYSGDPEGILKEYELTMMACNGFHHSDMELLDSFLIAYPKRVISLRESGVFFLNDSQK